MTSDLSSLDMLLNRAIALSASGWWIAYIIGGLVAVLVLRRPPVDPAVMGVDRRDLTTDRWILAGWWVVLTGIVATGLSGAVSLAVYLAGALGQVGSLGDGAVGRGALAIWVPTAALALIALMAIVAFRRLDWPRLREATGYRLSLVARLLLFAMALPFLTWPVWRFLMLPWQVIQVREVFHMWGPAVTWADLAAEPVATLLRTEAIWTTGLQAVAIVGAYVAAFLAARTVLWWFEGAHRAWFRDGGGRLTDLVVVLALTGVMAAGLVYAIELVTTLLREGLALVAVWTGADPTPGMSYGPGSPVSRLLWHALPLVVVYPAAAKLMGWLDRPAIEGRLGWTPSRTDARLLFLTLAAWLAWPFTVIEMLVGRYFYS